MADTALFFEPPPVDAPFDGVEWQDWFYRLYDRLGQNGVTTNKVSFAGNDANATLDTIKLDTDDLLTLDCGLLFDFSSASGNPLYGVTSNVRRSNGAQPTLGGQLNGYANRGVTGDTYGVVVGATSEFQSDSALYGSKASVNVKDPASVKPKFGLQVGFANDTSRGGLGGNHYNTFAYGVNLLSQVRSAAGEFCGWNIGINFFDGSLDISNPPAWDINTTYLAGAIVSNGGQLWKAIITNKGVAPVAGVTWCVRSTTAGSGGYGVTNYAVGLDFTGMSAANAAKMWSAIRFQAGQAFSWEETGLVASLYDRINGRMSVVSLYAGGYVNSLGVDPSGILILGQGQIPLGGGAAPTLGTIGGVGGPATAAQNAWLTFHDNLGAKFFIPIWK